MTIRWEEWMREKRIIKENNLVNKLDTKFYKMKMNFIDLQNVAGLVDLHCILQMDFLKWTVLKCELIKILFQFFYNFNSF